MTTTLNAKKAIEGSKLDILKKANVVAVGVGFKTKAGVRTNDVCIVVSVEKKLPVEKLSAQDVIPQSIGGVITDVIQTGKIVALKERYEKWRPYPAGVSIGHKDITAGTLGSFVKRGEDILLLSNNHVFANSNAGSIGDAIYQPGKYDGGTESDTVANLLDFVPISFSGDTTPTCPIGGFFETLFNLLAKIIGSKHRFSLFQEVKPKADEINRVDCAIAKPTNPSDMELIILEIGDVQGMADAELGMQLQKSGRTTGYTQDTVLQLHVTAQVDYGGPIAVFDEQIMAGPMSQGGDSGSLVLNMDNYAVGLLFAGSNTTTIINPIQDVMDKLQVEFLTQQDKFGQMSRKLKIWYPNS